MPEPYHCIPEPTKAQVDSTPICEVTCADGLPPEVRLVPEPPAGLALVACVLVLAALGRWR